MSLTPGQRKLVLTAHIVSSVGWFGAACAYLAIAIIALASADPFLARAAYRLMWLLGWYVIVPFSVAAMLAGLVQSLATPWGLFRHWWILSKFVLTTVATVVLVTHMRAVGYVSGIAAGALMSAADHWEERLQLVVHPAGGLLVLLVVTLLSVYKPLGLTPYGQRVAGEDSVDADGGATEIAGVAAGRQSSARALRAPRWVYIVGIHAATLAVLAVIAHLVSGGPRRH